MLCCDREKKINPISSVCSKLAHVARHKWEEKVIHSELCQKYKLNHYTKWYIHKPESVLENATHKNLWDSK